ncbi:MAG: ABC transporter permease [Giesbergeria sp.]|uniref:ABC transporter permease n=1 Tax=Giesbergeria sp. TaxID=2818473 RepID=UPI0026300811|nr:ABC transporter permease [Giesbergeria sp.]MDD2608801.1 ABC transporter permease [Giesbergeria sp.]
MGWFLLQRLGWMLAALLAASAAIFGILDVLPGNAAQVLMGPEADPEAVAALAAELGLDQPALQRYGQWLWGLLTGDLGDSYAYGSPVADLLQERLAVTVPLALLAISLSTALAFAAGLYAAAHQQRWDGAAVMGLVQLGMAVPGFWLAIGLIWLFSIQLPWFSAGGFPGWTAAEGGGLWPALQALLLPAVALALVQAAILARTLRSALLEVLHEDFVRTARAKGLSYRQVLWGHALRNAMIPVLTIMGLQFANLLAGAVVIENVFQLPGLGRLLFQAIANRDLLVVRNGVLLLAALVIGVNFVVDMLHALIDPRLTAQRRAIR